MIHGVQAELEVKNVLSDNLGQNFVGKSTKLVEIGFSMECFPKSPKDSS